jgi:hypothetical protein
VAQLSYHTAHPVTRLDVMDPSLPLTVSLSVFSPFKLWPAEGSAVPAVTFTLSLHNPTTAPMDPIQSQYLAWPVPNFKYL